MTWPPLVAVGACLLALSSQLGAARRSDFGNHVMFETVL